MLHLDALDADMDLVEGFYRNRQRACLEDSSDADSILNIQQTLKRKMTRMFGCFRAADVFLSCCRQRRARLRS